MQQPMANQDAANLPPHASVAGGPNAFVELWEKVKHEGHNLAGFAENFAKNFNVKMAEEKAIEPDLKAALTAIYHDVTLLVTQASAAVAAKGLNPSQDYEVKLQIEQLVADYNKYLPTFEKFFQILGEKETTSVVESKPTTITPDTAPTVKLNTVGTNVSDKTVLTGQAATAGVKPLNTPAPPDTKPPAPTKAPEPTKPAPPSPAPASSVEPVKSDSKS